MQKVGAIIEGKLSFLKGDVLVLSQNVILAGDLASRFLVVAFNEDNGLLVLKKLAYQSKSIPGNQARVGDFFVFQFPAGQGDHEASFFVDDVPLMVFSRKKPQFDNDSPVLALSARHESVESMKLDGVIVSPVALFSIGRRVARVGLDEGALLVTALNSSENLVAVHREGYTAYVDRSTGLAYSEACLMIFPLSSGGKKWSTDHRRRQGNSGVSSLSLRPCTSVLSLSFSENDFGISVLTKTFFPQKICFESQERLLSHENLRWNF